VAAVKVEEKIETPEPKSATKQAVKRKSTPAAEVTSPKVQKSEPEAEVDPENDIRKLKINFYLGKINLNSKNKLLF
jgi:hypothetical protein